MFIYLGKRLRGGGPSRYLLQRHLEDSLKDWVRPLQFLLTVGWYVALSLVIPVGIGYWLDRPGMLNKSPLFTFIGLAVGTVIAFGGLIRMLLRYQAEQEESKKISRTKNNGSRSP